MTRPRKPPWEVTCPCGTVFTVSGRGKAPTRYCSPVCAYNATATPERKEQRREYRRSRPECEFEGCDKPIFTYPLCAGHNAQKKKGKSLTPLQPRKTWRWHEPAGPCSLPGCERLHFSKSLCRRHDTQCRVAGLDAATLIAGFLRADDVCAYCLDALGTDFEIDHAHDGDCVDAHRGQQRMCPACIRGFIHRRCNRELVGIDSAIRGGRLVKPAPQLAAYLQGRPFLEWCA